MNTWQEKAVALAQTGAVSWRQISEAIRVPKSTVSDFLRMHIHHQEAENIGVVNEFLPQEEDNSRILFISDMHIPYHHSGLLPFLEGLKKRYEPTRVISLGDECFPGDVEILTPGGFVRFDTLPEDAEVAQWHENGTMSWCLSLRKIKKDFNGNLLEHRHSTYVSRTTPRHNIVKINPLTGKVHRREAWDVGGTASWYIPRSGVMEAGQGHALGDDEIRLLVAFQADGTFTKGAVRWNFNKERKAKRLIGLLESTAVPYNVHSIARGGFQFYVEVANVPSYLTKSFDSFSLRNWTEAQRNVFIEELELWDGTPTPGGFRYTSATKSNVEYVAAILVLAGYTPGRVVEAEGSHYVDVRRNREKCSLKSAVTSDIPHNDAVYCVTVPSGMIVVRTDGFVGVSGNCDKHSLSFHDSDPDLDSAGPELEKALPVIAEVEKLFPVMDLIDSNHGSMVYRKSKHHGIPRRYIRSYNEVLGVGDGWKWHMDLTLDLPDGQKVYVHHGKSSDALKVSQAMGMSHVCGHYHESFGIKYWANPLGLYWAMNTGCLINNKSLAFAYNNANLKRPIIGTGLIIDGVPILETMPL